MLKMLDQRSKRSNLDEVNDQRVKIGGNGAEVKDQRSGQYSTS